jgi:hypothetical protein
MAKKNSMNMLGGWAFLIGVVLAIILGAGFLPNSPLLLSILVIIGLVVGILNVTGNEVSSFMMAGAVLIIASSLGQTSMAAIPIVGNILDSLLAIFVPATIIVAIKHAFTLARN